MCKINWYGMLHAWLSNNCRKPNHSMAMDEQICGENNRKNHLLGLTTNICVIYRFLCNNRLHKRILIEIGSEFKWSSCACSSINSFFFNQAS